MTLKINENKDNYLFMKVKEILFHDPTYINQLLLNIKIRILTSGLNFKKML